MKKIISTLLLFTAAILMNGCTASYQSEFMTPQTYMQNQASILIVTPENGRYETIEYPSSGIDVASTLAQELGKYSSKIATIPTPVTINDIGDDVLQQYNYVFIPQILHWEDRATGWSFRPDRIEILFEIYNNKRELIDAYRIKGRSAYVVWVSKQPKSLLPRPIRTMCEDLFGKIQN